MAGSWENEAEAIWRELRGKQEEEQRKKAEVSRF